jgi:hypothetical protein
MNERKLYPYPITILMDRYSGMSAGGTFTAWNREADTIPDDVYGGDFEAIDFWKEYWEDYDKITREWEVIGIGNTPNDAVEDLIRRQKEKGLFYGIY